MAVIAEVEFEKRLYKSRRADVIYRGVVIEYKKPFALDNKQVVDTATDELSDYLTGLGRSEKILRRFVGVALDGEKILFVRAKPQQDYGEKGQSTLDGRILVQSREVEVTGPTRINAAAIEQFLIYLRQLDRRILSPETLSED